MRHETTPKVYILVPNITQIPFTVQSGSRLNEMYVPYGTSGENANWPARPLNHFKMTGKFPHSHFITFGNFVGREPPYNTQCIFINSV